MTQYTIRQTDTGGKIVSEVRVEAANTDGALRQLEGLAQDTSIIDVLDDGGEKLRQVHPSFWKKRLSRSR